MEALDRPFEPVAVKPQPAQGQVRIRASRNPAEEYKMQADKDQDRHHDERVPTLKCCHGREAQRNRLTGEASVAPCSVENEIAEAGSTGWLGGGTARCQSMEGMLHHRNKSGQASNTLTRFGQPFHNACKGLLSSSPEPAFTPECLRFGHCPRLQPLTCSIPGCPMLVKVEHSQLLLHRCNVPE